MSDSPTRVYQKGQLTVEWWADRCIHCENCINSLPEVFKVGERPWINIENADCDEIASVCDACPSKALIAEWQ